MPPWIGRGCRGLLLLMEARLYAARSRTEIRHEVAVLCHTSVEFNVQLAARTSAVRQSSSPAVTGLGRVEPLTDATVVYWLVTTRCRPMRLAALEQPIPR